MHCQPSSSLLANLADDGPSLSLRQRRRRRCTAVAAVLVLAVASTSTITISWYSEEDNASSASISSSSSSLFLSGFPPSVTAFSSPSSFRVPFAPRFTSRPNLPHHQHHHHTSSLLFAAQNTDLVVLSDTTKSSSEEECAIGTQFLCMDQHEFEMHVGRAMDTLRDDYPMILTKNPDYGIYDPMVELVDPSGVRLHGVKNYKNVYRLLHAIVNIFYCPERSGLTFRMCFDKARQNIRIHWNAQVIPKKIFGGYKTTLHADGISIYEFDRSTGNITQHRLERLVINDAPVTPEQGIFAALRGHAIKSEVEGIPVFNIETTSIKENAQDTFDGILQYQPSSVRNIINNPMMTSSSSGSVLFSDSSEEEEQQHLMQQNQHQSRTEESTSASSTAMFSSDTTASTTSSSSTFDNIDVETLQKKNLARKKFGLKPLTPEEFLKLQEQVAELDNEQKKKADAHAAAAALAAQQQEKKDRGNVLNNLFGNILKDTCETNFDCEWPQVCCDFGFKKTCCSSGMRILDGPPQSRQGQLAEIPVPQGNDDFPPNDPRSRGLGRY